MASKNITKKKEKIAKTFEIEKIVLSAGATAEKLDKSVKLLGLITGENPSRRVSHKRIPSLGVRPGLETGVKVTIRDKEKINILLKRLLQAVNNEIKESQIVNNHFSFGIHEYIEIPGIEYQREIGVLGLNVTVDFVRPGKRVSLRKIKRGKMPRRQEVSKEEIKEYMQRNFDLKFKEKSK